MALQDLPPELLLQVLSSTLTLPALLSLALTSRKLYSLFLTSQATLIYSVLATELGPDVLSDALILADIRDLDHASPAFLDTVEAILSTYDAYLARGPARHHHPAAHQFSLEQVLRLVRDYRVVGFVAGLYATCTLGMIRNEIVPSFSGQDLKEEDAAAAAAAMTAPLSRVEWLRILRAFYRLQMILFLWGGSWKGYSMCKHDPEADRVNFRLFGLWDVWEVEAVFGAGAFYQKFRVQLAKEWVEDYRKHPTANRLTYRTRVWFGEFREVVGRIHDEDEEVWQRVVEEMSRFSSGIEAAGVQQRSRSGWFRYSVDSYSRTKGLPERHWYPASLRFYGESVDTVPFGWVDAFDGLYAADFFKRVWGLLGNEDRWSLVGFLIWDTGRIQALKTSALLSRFTTGWAGSGWI